MRSTAYHQQANYITQQVLQVVHDNREQVLQEVKATEETILRALNVKHMKELDTASASTGTTATSTLTANSVTSDPIQLQMLQILQKIESKLDSNNKTPVRRNPPEGRRSRPFTRKNTSKYCWSHGACSHTGRECNAPKPGHQSDATFENKMGGSTLCCPGTS